MGTRIRLVLAGGAALGVGLGLTACSPGDVIAGLTPLEATALAATTTEHQRTAQAQVTAHEVITTGGKTETIDLTGTGGFDFSASAADLNLTMTGVQGLPSGGAVVEVRLIGGNVYEDIGSMVGSVPGFKPWISVDLSQAMGQDPSLGASSANPTDFLNLLRAKGSTVTALGTKTRNGVELTGFSAVPDLQKQQQTVTAVWNSMGIPAAEQQRLLTEFTANPPGVDIWVDGGGLVRQMSVNESITVPVPTGTVGLRISEDMSFDHYGSPVSVSAPPADQVMTFPQFIQAAKAAQAGSVG